MRRGAPAADGIASAGPNSNERFHQVWDPYIGPEAARLRYTCYRIRLWEWRSGLCMGAAIIGLIATKHTSIEWVFRSLILLFFGCVLLAACLWFRERGKQYAAASRFLGVKISSRCFPPRNEKAFERWCEDHGAAHPTSGRSPGDDQVRGPL